VACLLCKHFDYMPVWPERTLKLTTLCLESSKSFMVLECQKPPRIYQYGVVMILSPPATLIVESINFDTVILGKAEELCLRRGEPSEALTKRITIIVGRLVPRLRSKK
jgi:hypothetical protein